jgi:hypothetical protein
MTAALQGYQRIALLYDLPESVISDLAGNQIMLGRGFSHLGALALNRNRSPARNSNTKLQLD